MAGVLGWVAGLRLWNAFALAAGLLIGLVVACAGFVHFAEGWGWIDSVYFAVVSLATVGYGDLAPSNDATKVFLIGFLPVGIGLWFIALGTLAVKLFDLHRRSLERVRDAAMGPRGRG